MLEIAICDDNRTELNAIVKTVEKIMSDSDISFKIALFNKPEELIQNIKAGKFYDLYILDVIMPAINGIEVASVIKRIKKYSCFIFLTSSTDYAFEAFGIRALDYILKPVNHDRLDETIQRFINYSKRGNSTLVVKTRSGSEAAAYKDIMYIEYSSHKVMVQCTNDRKVYSAYMRESFSSFCTELINYPFFVKVHVSYVVNIKYIKTIRKECCILSDGTAVPVSRSCYGNLRQKYMDMLFKGGF